MNICAAVVPGGINPEKAAEAPVVREIVRTH
jgi:hypothetical protein